MKQPHVMKPAVCVMLSLFMHVALGIWIVHAIQPTHQNWQPIQPIQPIQVSLVSETWDPASGSETGQVDQISELTHVPTSTSGDLESAPTQVAEIEQKTDPIEPGAKSEFIQKVWQTQESDAYEPELPELETSVSESNSERMQIQDNAVERMAVMPVTKSIDPAETEPQILSARYSDNEKFDFNDLQAVWTEIETSDANISDPVQQDIQQESIDLDNSRAVWTELETNEANPVELLQVAALTTEFNIEQVEAELVEITDLDAERSAWNEPESELTSHSEPLQFTVLTVKSTAEEMTIDTENWLDDVDQIAGMNFEPEDYRDLTQPVSIQELEIEMAASIEMVSQHLEESKQSAESQIEVDFENNATLSDFELEVAHLNISDTEQIEFIAFNSPDSVLEVPEPEQSDQLDLNENVGIEGQPENDRIASLEQKQQPKLINIEKLQKSKAITAEQSTVANKVIQSVAQTKPILENKIASPAKDRTRKEESPKQFAAFDHSKQQIGEPKNRDQSSGHLQTTNLDAVSLPMSSQPRFGVEGLANPAPRYPYLSRSREEQGKVILQVYIDKKGRASRIETIQSSGHSRLDKAARKAVKNWTFMPALEDGNPTTGVVQVPISFVLKN